MENNTEDYVRTAILEDPFEAQIAAGMLHEENIPHIIRSYHDTAYDGLFQAQKGWGEIRAPRQYTDQILEILEDYRSEIPESLPENSDE
ncbi:MAG: hypothetical protein AB7S75_07535 [Desulfococcaceae bacterium]